MSTRRSLGAISSIKYPQRGRESKKIEDEHQVDEPNLPLITSPTSPNGNSAALLDGDDRVEVNFREGFVRADGVRDSTSPMGVT